MSFLCPKIYFSPTILDQVKYLLVELADEQMRPDEDTGSFFSNGKGARRNN